MVGGGGGGWLVVLIAQVVLRVLLVLLVLLALVVLLVLMLLPDPCSLPRVLSEPKRTQSYKVFIRNIGRLAIAGAFQADLRFVLDLLDAK